MYLSIATLSDGRHRLWDQKEIENDLSRERTVSLAMPAKEDDLVLRPRWRTRVQSFDFPFKNYPAIVTIVLEPETGGYLERNRDQPTSSTRTQTRLTACGSHQRFHHTRANKVRGYVRHPHLILDHLGGRVHGGSGVKEISSLICVRTDLYERCSAACP